MKKENKIAIVATSPLQIMLAHEISKKYNPKYVKCFIMTYNGDNRYPKCEKLAYDYGYEVQPMQMANLSTRWSIIKNSVSSFFHNNDYDIVIQGIFTIVFFYSFSMKLLKNGGQLIITDDGVATFQLEEPSIVGPLFQSKVLRNIFRIMAYRKIKHNLYYTIFEKIQSPHYELKKLNLNSSNLKNTPRGVYFIGTYQAAYVPKYSPQLTENQFYNLIAETVKYIRKKYNTEEIMYTPHGRESEQTSLNICNIWNLHYLPTKVSVEVDYPLNGHYPKVIVGFMSTALFTLRAMFPKAQVIDIRPANSKFIQTDTLEKTNLSEDEIGIKRIYVNI